VNITKIAALVAGPVIVASMLLGASAASAASQPCVPMMPSPASRYYNVTTCPNSPSTFWIMRGGPDLWVSGTHWSYHPGWAKATGTLWGADIGANNLGRVTLVFSNVYWGGMAFPGFYYEHLHIYGGQDVVRSWHFHFSTAVLDAGWTS
jgi:hypothetical protein